MREASTLTSPAPVRTVISRQLRIEKPSPDTSASVSEARMSRALGPHRPIVEISSVRSVERGLADEVVREPLPVGRAVRATGDDAEVVVAQPHHGQVGAEAALASSTGV